MFSGRQTLTPVTCRPIGYIPHYQSPTNARTASQTCEPRVKVNIVGSLRDREVACSATDRQGSNFESCVWRTVSSHHPQEVLMAQFGLYVHQGGLKPDSFHFTDLWSTHWHNVNKRAAVTLVLVVVGPTVTRVRPGPAKCCLTTTSSEEVKVCGVCLGMVGDN